MPPSEVVRIQSATGGTRLGGHGAVLHPLPHGVLAPADLFGGLLNERRRVAGGDGVRVVQIARGLPHHLGQDPRCFLTQRPAEQGQKIGRASCRERGSSTAAAARETEEL